MYLTACGGGNGNGLDENGQPIGDKDTELTSTLASIQQHVFTPRCSESGCHGGGSSSGGLTLDSETSSRNNLVNITSPNYPAYLRVNPSNPDDSLLIRKLEGAADTGQRMPRLRPALPAETIEVIRQWITNGAVD